MLSMCVSVSVVSHRGDGLHMQSVFTGLKEIMTIAENPLAISLRSHFSFVCVSLCVHFVWGHGVCCLCKPVCVPRIFSVSTLACTVYYAYLSVTGNQNKNIPYFPLACQSEVWDVYTHTRVYLSICVQGWWVGVSSVVWVFNSSKEGFSTSAEGH